MLILLYPLVMSKVSYGKIHHFYSWEKPLFLWPFSMAMLNYQRVSPVFLLDFDHHLRKDLIIRWRSPLFLMGDVQLRHVQFPCFDGDFLWGYHGQCHHT